MASSIVHFDAEKHEYSDDSGKVYPSVTQVLKASGKMCYGAISDEVRDKAWHLGTQVHYLLELEDVGALNYRTVPKALRGYRKAWLAWKKASGFVIECIEEAFISSYGFAGRLDRTGAIGFSYATLDIKTGVTIPDWVRMQLSAYSQHHFRGPSRRIALRLLPDGNYRAKEFPVAQHATDFAEFYECLTRMKCQQK